MKTTIAVCLLAVAASTNHRAHSAEPPAELARWLDPQQWEKDTAGPIVSLGAAGEFDDVHIFAPAVAEWDGRFQMWYCGSRGTRSARVFRLGLATSRDGKRFEKHAENPVLAFADHARPSAHRRRQRPARTRQSPHVVQLHRLRQDRFAHAP
jgi:hypothetical protein